jgi:hypothetical protein
MSVVIYEQPLTKKPLGGGGGGGGGEGFLKNA